MTSPWDFHYRKGGEIEMAEYGQLDKNNTNLSEYGLTYDRIMEGRRAELEAEKKVRRKESYVLQEAVNEIVAAYADDLLDAYEIIEEMEIVIEDQDGQLKEAKVAFDKSQDQVRTVVKGSDTMKDVEDAMAQLDNQMSRLSEANYQSEEEINNLRLMLEQRAEELHAERDKIDAMSRDVSEVLSNLERYLDEEGIVME